MAQQTINVATANSGTGDPLRDAMIKANDNFDELYANIYTPSDISFGGYGMAANTTATTISAAGTYYKVSGTTTSNLLGDFTHTNNRLTYTGTTPKIFKIAASPISMISAGTNVIVSLKLAKNGTVVGYPVTRKISTGSDIGACSISFDVALVTNNYIELFVTNETSTSSVTVEDLYLSIHEITTSA